MSRLAKRSAADLFFQNNLAYSYKFLKVSHLLFSPPGAVYVTWIDLHVIVY
jgi:hypothetical protein